MSAHWIAWTTGALLIVLCAAARNSRGIPPSPPRATSAELKSAEEADRSSETPLNLRERLREWREQCIAALPEPLRQDGESVKAIDVRYDAALRSQGILSIRFVTEEGEQKEFTLATTPLSESQQYQLDFWKTWRQQAIEALPEDLRADSDHRRAVDEAYRNGLRAFLSEEEAASLEEGTESLVNGGLAVEASASNSLVVTLESARLEIYDLRATAVQTLMRVHPQYLSDKESLQEYFTAEPVDHHQGVLDFWGDWKSQAIAALPEGLREDSEYQAAIEATYQAALLSLGVTPHPSAPASVGASKMD